MIDAAQLGRKGGSMQTGLSDYPTMRWRRRYGLLALIWSVLVIGSLALDIAQEKQSTLRTATAAALASINKDISFRKWVNSHGGVYVPPTEHTPPNPYLNVPDRDVVTTTGVALTLMNPAYALREMQNDFSNDFGTRSHITSLKLLNPKNAPDAWETTALHSFEQGTKELLEIQQIDGESYLRLMRPFFVDRGCLKCHAQQGYKEGDIRGGISSAISLKPYLARERELSANMALSHGTIWLLGLAGLGFSFRRDRRQAEERETAANALRASESQMRLLLDSAAEAIYGIDLHGNCTFCNLSCLRILGYQHTGELTGKNMHDLIHNRYADGTCFPVEDCRIFRAFLTGQNSHVDDEVLWRADGTCFPAEYWSHPQIIDGNVVGAVVTFMDITERKLAEEQIRRSEHSLSEAQRIAHLGSWDLDIVNNVLTWSDEIYRIFEIDPEKFGATYDAFLDAIHPDDRELVNNAYTESLKNRLPYNIAHRLLMKDGRVKYVNEICETYYGEDGSPLRSFGIVHDITERKQAEEALRESEARLQLERDNLQNIVGSMGDGVYIVNADYDIEYINPVIEKLFGPAGGRKCYEYFHDRTEACPWCKNPEVFAGKPVRWEWTSKKTGQTFDLFDAPLRHADGHVSKIEFFHDITDSKRGEEALRKSEEQFRAIFDNAAIGIARISTAGRFLEINGEFCRIIGYTREEVLSQEFTFQQITFPEDIEPDLASVNKLLDGVGDDYAMEKRYIRKDGSIAWVNLSVHLLRDNERNPLYFISAVQDITERKLSEKELWEKEERLALATLHNGVGVWDWNLITQEMVWDDSMFSLYHIRREDFIGTEEAWRAALHPDDLHRGDQEVNDAIAGKKPFDTEFRVVWPNGEIHHIKAVAKVFRDERGTPLRMLGINMDITEHKQMEEEITKLNRSLESRVIERTAELEASNKDMESFSYSISHDLRAPLRAINGFSKILQEDYAARLDDEGKRLLNVVGDNAQKMGELIDDILAFSRAGRNEIRRSVIDMKKMVAGVWEELKPEMTGRNVHLELRDMPPAEGDAAMIHQVVFNLLANAVKFTQRHTDARIEVGGQTDEHETVYHVEDNGVGFDMQYADKLFGVFLRLHGADEFEGTGIGLAIVKRIITKHGGRVWAEGKINGGATFYFALPKR